MSLIVLDALNLSYLLVKSTAQGLFYGGSWIYGRMQAPAALEAPPAAGEAEAEPQLSGAERRLLRAFQGLPSWLREQRLAEALYASNTEVLVNFSFGDRGPLVLLRFVDLRTGHALALVSCRLDPERNVEQLRQALRLFERRVQPDLYACDWFALRVERRDGETTYMRKEFILNSDSLSALQPDTEEQAGDTPQTIDVHVDF